uniref:ZP domain-containing protein n=1 Tax=Setaria digitata TaxID=48799 RepID=A0A915PF70_9BILA
MFRKNFIAYKNSCSMNKYSESSDDNVNEKTVDGITSLELFNPKYTSVDDTYSPVQFTTAIYEPQQSTKDHGAAPPAAMPIIDYSDEQKQISDSAVQNEELRFRCTDSDESVNNEDVTESIPETFQYSASSDFTIPSSPLLSSSLSAAKTTTISPIEESNFSINSLKNGEKIGEYLITESVKNVAITENDDASYGASEGFTYVTASDTVTTTTIVPLSTRRTSEVLPPCVSQMPNENEQIFTSSTASIISSEYATHAETSPMTESNPEENATLESIPENTTATATAMIFTLQTNDHLTAIKHTNEPLSGLKNMLRSFPKLITPFPILSSTGRIIEKDKKLEMFDDDKKDDIVIGQPSSSQIQSSIHPSFELSTISVTNSISPHINTTPAGIVHNRLRGKARLICKEDGLQFGISTLFPFTGQIFARDRKPAPQFVHLHNLFHRKCYFTFRKATTVTVTMPYSECGIRNIEMQRPETQYHMRIVVIFQQKDNTSTMQSFLTQCVHQKVQYQKQVIPKRIEEALEELRLIPIKLEHKARVPECIMRIVTEDEGHGHGNDADGIEMEVVNLGQPMRIEWSLVPETDAYGFHVRNCTVRDTVSNEEYMVIDERGCSTDINIFSHPHYDTYHDIARVHWHAFKVPDNTQLSIKCSMEICTDIPDSISGLTSCDSIPSPPFCPDLITSPTNALLSGQEAIVIRKRREYQSLQQHVHADICFGDKKDAYCNSENYRADHERHVNMFKANSSKRYCLSRLWLTVWTGLSLTTTLLAITVHGYCRYFRRRQFETI